ncbi:MAG: hypothetical protein JWS10_2588 [Cypionkella sp.]|nr:hypothetical protein [Cypionkella sp.]
MAISDRVARFYRFWRDPSWRLGAVGVAVTPSMPLTRDTLPKGFGLIFATFCGK